MSFNIFEKFIKPVEFKPVVEPETQPEPLVEPLPLVTNNDAKRFDTQFLGANNRIALEKKLPTAKPTTYGALEEINKLPKPDPNNPAAGKTYKQRVAQIADNAIKNSAPPNRQTYLNAGLNGRTADFEYQEAKTNYDSQINQLKSFAADAEKYPDKILTLSEAITEIDNLPRPDRSNPQSVLEYNNRRAAIADSALLYAKPPKREDFNDLGLNGATRNMEYENALSAYSSNILRFQKYSAQEGTNILPSLETAEVDAEAARILSNHNGGQTEEDAYAVGREIAEIAKNDPQGAIWLMQKVQETLQTTDKGDNVASGFIDNVSNYNLNEIVYLPDGKETLENLKNKLLTGPVYSSEVEQAQRIAQVVVDFDNDPAKTFTTDEGIPANPDGYFTTPGTEVPQVTADVIKSELEDENVYLAQTQYLQTIERHKDDPQWLNTFYQTLGTDKTAELISQTVLSVPPPTDRELQLVGQSLQTLVKGGLLTQADIDNLVVKTITNSEFGGLHRGNLTFLTEAISKLPNDTAGVQLKNMLSSTLSRTAAGHLPADISEDFNIDDAKEFLARAATRIISTTPESNQVDQLDKLQGVLGEDGFAELINRSLQSDGEFADNFGNFYENYDGMVILLKSVGNNPDASSELSTQLFDITSRNLVSSDSGVTEKYRENIDFKEGLGNIYKNNQDAITNNYLGENGYDITSDGLKQLNGFFREVLFTPPLAENAKDVAADFTTRANTVLADADKLSDSEFQAKYGKDKREMTSLVGEQYGVMINAMEESLANIKDRSDEEAGQIIGVINGIISAGQIGVSATGPQGIAVAILGEPLKLALGSVGDDIAAGRYDEAIEKLKDDGIDPDRFNDYAVNDVLTQIDDPVAHDSFRDAFDYVKEILD